MNIAALDFRDPLFGIMAFLLIVATVAIFFVIIERIKESSEAKKIRNFLAKFSGDSETADYLALLREYPNSYELLQKAAKAHDKAGEYEKSIKIYLALLEWVPIFEREKKASILESLGDIYAKSGFLSRSTVAYEEALSLFPKNKNVLSKILRLYEKKGELSKALEAIEALEELGYNTGEQKEFLKLLIDIKRADNDKKIPLLKSAATKNIHFAREYLRELFQRDQREAFLFLESNMRVEFLDIIFAHDIQGEYFSNASNKLLKAALCAKGLEGYDDTKSDIFELDALNCLKKYAPSLGASIKFEFVCKRCGAYDIDYFFSCKSCGAILECQTLLSLVKTESTEKEVESW